MVKAFKKGVATWSGLNAKIKHYTFQVTTTIKTKS
jgi:hypothetical protein